jgi:uracil-DNA glycosylase
MGEGHWMTDAAVPLPPFADSEAITLLRWWLESGLHVALNEQPVSWLAAAPKPVQPERAPEKAIRAPETAPVRSSTFTMTGLADISSLAALEEHVRAFDQCALKATATNTVFADGIPASRVMLIGEAPGADEDRIGRPFVGQAGQLLDRMMATIDRTRHGESVQSVYITNVLYWRPPGNRPPTAQEIQLCLPFLLRHIELVDPVVIFTLGAVPFQALVNTNEGITRARGSWRSLEINGKTYPLLPTLHPAFLLRQPAQKANSWHDLVSLKKFLEMSET